jgi:membrane-bound lytic murein transglycosylase D
VTGFFIIIAVMRFLPILFLFLIPLSGSGGSGMADDKDMLYEYRIAQLNKLSPIALDYNEDVRKYIDLYTGPRKAEMARIIGLSRLYFPIFDDILDRHSLPHELKYLTIVESGLNPLAVSKSGAVGLWQFLLNTSRLFDLEVNSYVDERRDPYKSTESACRYLHYLNTTFNDWQLVLASYNGGPGEVRKAIERCKGETGYWKLRPHLSEQARNYVPAFIAAFYLMNFYEQHGIVPEAPAYDYRGLDTLHIRYAITFEQISSYIDLPVDKIRLLNPVYRRDYIPEKASGSVLVLPADKIRLYLEHETSILGFSLTPPDYNLMVQQSGNTAGKTKVVHVVQPGEVTHKIAMKYDCTLENIKIWNNMEGFEVKAGQQLVIWIEEKK